MSYDVNVYRLAKLFALEHKLTDEETAKLAQHIQTEIESECAYLKIVRKEPHADPSGVDLA